MRLLGLAALALMLVQGAMAKESTDGMSITSPKDALLLISTDKLGTISLASLAKDIKSDVVYRARTRYSTGHISLQSQNDHGRYGEVEFEFKPPHNLTKEDVVAQSRLIKDVKVTDSGTRTYLRWDSHGFRCSLDFDADPKFPLFQYICHQSEKKGWPATRQPDELGYHLRSDHRFEAAWRTGSKNG